VLEAGTHDALGFIGLVRPDLNRQNTAGTQPERNSDRQVPDRIETVGSAVKRMQVCTRCIRSGAVKKAAR